MPARLSALVGALTIVAIAATTPAAGRQQPEFGVTFTDETIAWNLHYDGPSRGASGGDLDGDGDVDLWTPNGDQTPVLWFNTGTSFLPTSTQIESALSSDNMRGAVIADFDGDGDSDIFQMVDGGAALGRARSQLYINEDGVLRARIDEPLTGADRQDAGVAVWDADGDRDLDILVTANSNTRFRPGQLLLQRGALFVQGDVAANLRDDAELAVLVRPRVSDTPIAYLGGARFPTRTLEVTPPHIFLPREESGAVRDVVAGDFDGDAEMELFLARAAVTSSIVQPDAEHVSFDLFANAGLQLVAFTTESPIEVSVAPRATLEPTLIAIGASGRSPNDVAFSLNPAFDQGEPFENGTAQLLISGLGDGRWSFRLVAGGLNRWTIDVASTAPIQEISTTGIDDERRRIEDHVLDPIAGTVTLTEGKTECVSATAHDFDNDGDIDVYMACTSGAGNFVNVLLDNDGNAILTSIEGAAGAVGPAAGRADVVTAADVNDDGFMDLYLTNGAGVPFGFGPSQLYINGGNDNHWAKVALIGTESNDAGIGAAVVLTVGDRQYRRDQFLGVHRDAQDDSRLHFGVGAATSIDRITVYWPSGRL